MSMRYLSIDIETTGLDPNKHAVISLAAVADDLSTDALVGVPSLPYFQALICTDLLPMTPYCANMHSEMWESFTQSSEYMLRILKQLGPQSDWTQFADKVEICGDEYRVEGISPGVLLLSADQPTPMTFPGKEIHLTIGQTAVSALFEWYDSNVAQTPGEKITPAGKNFAGFDKAFLQQLARSNPQLNPMGQLDRLRHRVVDPGPMYLRPDDAVPPSLPECMSRAGLTPVAEHLALGDAMDVVSVVRQSPQFRDFCKEKHMIALATE